MVTNLACTVEEQQPSLYVLSTTYQHPPLLMSMLDVDVNALDLLRESTYLRWYPKKVWIWCYKRLILLTKCSWRKVGLRERRSRGDSWRKVLLFGRKIVKKTFSLAFLKKILFQNISWYTDIFASVPLHAPPPPCQYFLSVPLVVKQNRQMSSQLVSKASATANVLKSDNL